MDNISTSSYVEGTMIDKKSLIFPVASSQSVWSEFGKDVTFYRFPGESHELSRSGSPVHRVQRAEIILDFFAKHLGA